MCSKNEIEMKPTRNGMQVQELGLLITDCPCVAADLGKVFAQYWDMGATNASLPPTWPTGYSTAYNASNPFRLSLSVPTQEGASSSRTSPLWENITLFISVLLFLLFLLPCCQTFFFHLAKPSRACLSWFSGRDLSTAGNIVTAEFTQILGTWGHVGLAENGPFSSKYLFNKTCLDIWKNYYHLKRYGDGRESFDEFI